MRANILNPVSRHFGRTQISFDIIFQRDDSTFGVDRLDCSFDDAVLIVNSDKTVEWIAFQLFYTQRYTLALDIDGQYHGLYFITLFVIAYGFLARLAP